ncbi:polysaccharide biosynthesis C-terminal domain-containing protein [Pelagibacterium mangrovi]|uniref:polysaccharide biosynthesis C-terminal domain-containing protein n=1 Tax=Pelagibacterium mangrovi TaxID=3119828 RepID=UPI002FC6A7BA
MKVVVTGAAGLLGWHTAVRLHAANCAARFRKETPPFEIVALDHGAFADDKKLSNALRNAHSVLHFAGVNRGKEEDIRDGNPLIAKRLADACKRLGVQPHITYANSTHARFDSVYGISKRRAGEILSSIGGGLANLVLPHIFGEGARPRYNNVTATFIEAVIGDETPDVDSNGQVHLLHSGAASDAAIKASVALYDGEISPTPVSTKVPELLELIQRFHVDYASNLFPDLSDTHTRDLFNCYRAALFPKGYPKHFELNSDSRGTLFEIVRGGGGGQTFASWTEPSVTRGDHFHLNKVERFVVLEGDALIRIRRALGGPVREYRVTGDIPVAIDMPTLHTHSIENVGNRPLLTLFWTHELFDPMAPDTYFDPVLQENA